MHGLCILPWLRQWPHTWPDLFYLYSFWSLSHNPDFFWADSSEELKNSSIHILVFISKRKIFWKHNIVFPNYLTSIVFKLFWSSMNFFVFIWIRISDKIQILQCVHTIALHLYLEFSLRFPPLELYLLEKQFLCPGFCWLCSHSVIWRFSVPCVRVLRARGLNRFRLFAWSKTALLKGI